VPLDTISGTVLIVGVTLMIAAATVVLGVVLVGG